MIYQQVFQRFLQLVGDDEKQQAEKYRWLCINAIDRLNDMLKESADINCCDSRFSAVASAMAFVRYIEICESVKSIKIGEVTVDYGERKKYAESYYKQCMQDMAEYIKDTGFSFRSVSV